jgi:hypothetical protein
VHELVWIKPLKLFNFLIIIPWRRRLLHDTSVIVANGVILWHWASDTLKINFIDNYHVYSVTVLRQVSYRVLSAGCGNDEHESCAYRRRESLQTTVNSTKRTVQWLDTNITATTVQWLQYTVHLLDKYSKFIQNARYIHQEKSDKFHVRGRWESHSFVTGVNDLFMHLEIVRHF